MEMSILILALSTNTSIRNKAKGSRLFWAGMYPEINPYIIR